MFFTLRISRILILKILLLVGILNASLSYVFKVLINRTCKKLKEVLCNNEIEILK
jgi:hypothetical protein